MITLQDMRDVAAQIKYLDWTLVIKADTSEPFLQWQFDAPDNDSPGVTARQFARKWKLSYHMIPQEIERTAHKALRAAVLHEMDENYTYKGQQIHHPHIDPDALAEFMKGRPIVSRETHV